MTIEAVVMVILNTYLHIVHAQAHTHQITIFVFIPQLKIEETVSDCPHEGGVNNEDFWLNGSFKELILVCSFPLQLQKMRKMSGKREKSKQDCLVKKKIALF